MYDKGLKTNRTEKSIQVTPIGLSYVLKHHQQRSRKRSFSINALGAGLDGAPPPQPGGTSGKGVKGAAWAATHPKVAAA